MENREIILELEGIDKHFGKIHAVNNLSFKIIKGNVYGLLGPNGSGKSTALGIILNVVNADSGTFTWFGGKIKTHEALKRIGAIIERPNFYPYMTATQNLELVCKIKNVPYSHIDDILKMTHLYERKNSKFKTFSLGMKQRLAIASALLNRPEILILDEPTNGLDPQGINEIRNIIKEIASQGTTILLASHLLDEVEKVCSHVIVLRKGKKLYEGKTGEMTRARELIEIKTDENYEKVKALLLMHSSIESVHQAENLIQILPKDNITAASINRFLIEQGIDIDYLNLRKPTLEQQFLELTNDK